MFDKNKKYVGFIMTELIVAMTILGILMVAFSVMLGVFSRFNRYQ